MASNDAPRRTTCPCKKIPLSLSSFTAAEYGDLASLSKIGSRIDVATKRDKGGYSPLHFSAQQNHVAACCLLLNQGCPVDGGGYEQGGCGATPLHRASFSGATAAMRVLIEWAAGRRDSSNSNININRTGNKDLREALLLARDTSFGDQATPLHKAAAGGRYLAVQLLIDTIREIPVDENRPRSSILQKSLEMKDASNRTPIDVARRYAAMQDTEQQAVARWDEVAGGKADWVKVVKILEHAMPSGPDVDDNGAKAGSVEHDQSVLSPDTKKESQTSILPDVPTFLIQDAKSCLDCGFDDGGNCLTTKWEQDFFRALNQSAKMTLDRPAVTVTLEQKNHITNSILIDAPMQNETQASRRSTAMIENPPATEASKSNTSSSTTCGACQRQTVALYPLHGRLVCKACKKSKVSPTMFPKVVPA